MSKRAKKQVPREKTKTDANASNREKPFRDVTKEEQNEEGLLKNKQELEKLVEERAKKLQEAERLAAIGQTAGMVGHDIRNPLQSIVSSSYLLKQEIADLPDNDAKKSMCESIETIDEQILYIDKIVSDLQEYSREIEPLKEEVNLNKIINHVLSNVRIPKNIEVQTSIDKKLEKMKTDPTCITRILTNLIINAVQAMPNGGKLSVDACQEGDKTILTVEDTGAGIPEEVKPKLFNPLFTTKAKGMGFGLAVCKRLIDALKGNITFESEKGKGAKFTIKLPAEN